MPRLDYSNATLAGLPAFQIRRLQSVLDAAARLIHRSPRHEQITPILRHLHWLRSPECIDSKLVVLVYRCLHGLAPHYLSDYCCLFQPSTTSFIVIIAATDSTNTTHNCRRPSFSSRRSRLWNGLPYVVTSAPTLAVFRKRLKTYLFSRSFTL